MDFTNLGRTGLTVSRLCLGCMSYGAPDRGYQKWALEEEGAQAFFRQALEGGINFFDTANSYSQGASEEITGRALRKMARRDEIVVATKAFMPWRGAPNTSGLSRKSLMEAVDASLKRLGMDYIDLYQIHRFDPKTPVEETMEALNDIVKAGKARYIGASSMPAWRFSKMQYTAAQNGWARFVSMQPQVSLIYREEEREMIPLCQDMGVGIIPWSPLGRGMLTRPWGGDGSKRLQMDTAGEMYSARSEEMSRAIVDAVEAIAKARGASMGSVALAWLLHKPGITAPIFGATKPQHLADALAAVDLKLTPEELEKLEAPYNPRWPSFGFPAPPAPRVSVLGDK
jgi:aryl-alcohol dehydrogenase-like predicted oxidoreductase